MRIYESGPTRICTHTHTGVDDVVGTACKAFPQLITYYAWTVLAMIFPSNMTGSLVGVRSASEKLVLMENVIAGLFRVSVLTFLAFPFK